MIPSQALQIPVMLPNTVRGKKRNINDKLKSLTLTLSTDRLKYSPFFIFLYWKVSLFLLPVQELQCNHHFYDVDSYSYIFIFTQILKPTENSSDLGFLIKTISSTQQINWIVVLVRMLGLVFHIFYQDIELFFLPQLDHLSLGFPSSSQYINNTETRSCFPVPIQCLSS